MGRSDPRDRKDFQRFDGLDGLNPWTQPHQSYTLSTDPMRGRTVWLALDSASCDLGDPDRSVSSTVLGLKFVVLTGVVVEPIADDLDLLASLHVSGRFSERVLRRFDLKGCLSKEWLLQARIGAGLGLPRRATTRCRQDDDRQDDRSGVTARQFVQRPRQAASRPQGWLIYHSIDLRKLGCLLASQLQLQSEFFHALLVAVPHDALGETRSNDEHKDDPSNSQDNAAQAHAASDRQERYSHGDERYGERHRRNGCTKALGIVQAGRGIIAGIGFKTSVVGHGVYRRRNSPSGAIGDPRSRLTGDARSSRRPPRTPDIGAGNRA